MFFEPVICKPRGRDSARHQNLGQVNDTLSLKPLSKSFITFHKAVPFSLSTHQRETNRSDALSFEGK